jgi:hypothetical protein
VLPRQQTGKTPTHERFFFLPPVLADDATAGGVDDDLCVDDDPLRDPILSEGCDDGWPTRSRPFTTAEEDDDRCVGFWGRGETILRSVSVDMATDRQGRERERGIRGRCWLESAAGGTS